MIIGVGTDVVEIERFRESLTREPSIENRLFTDAERAYCAQSINPIPRLAIRFAAKEAVMKAMGVGIGPVSWHDIEVVTTDRRPSIVLHNRAAALADRLGIQHWQLSLSHSKTTALAFAIGSSEIPVEFSPLLESEDRLDDGDLLPVVTVEEMRQIDADAPEPVEELIARAGAAVARVAIDLLGGTYGRRVAILYGKGNNGNDGREAARLLAARGVHVTLFDVATTTEIGECDLVIDAAFGTGFRGDYNPPIIPTTAKVLAVDIPSGVNGATGKVENALAANATVCFAALKPGNVFPPGRVLSGDIQLVDIGLDTSRATCHVVGAQAVSDWLVDADAETHKWKSAVWIVAGSIGMEGAASLTARGAARTGAGYIRASSPHCHLEDLPIEVVQKELSPTQWTNEVENELSRFSSLVIGNGLGTDIETRQGVRRIVALATNAHIPCVVDADGITALGEQLEDFVGPTTILTPHDGEFASVFGSRPSDDRLHDARALAAKAGAIVLLKGPTTVIAHPDGRALLSIAGDARLATAGTGDVLAGIIGALSASGMDPFLAAAAGAFLHGRAGALGWKRGFVASDIVEFLPAAIAQVVALRPATHLRSEE